jgi:lysophospholipase L1-like esterase
MSFAIDILARAALFPLLVIQALQVRRRALVLPEAAGPRSGTSGTGPELHLFVVGDSSAAGVGVATQDEALSGQLVRALAAKFRVSWHLDAQTGATTASTLTRLDDRTAHRCDIAVVALGVNDTTRAVPLSRWLRLQTELLDRLEDDFGAQRIYVSGLPPLGHFPLLPHPLRWVLGRQSRRLDQNLRQMLNTRSRCVYISMEFPMDISAMAEDGFHPGSQVYTAWANRVSDQIDQDLGNTLQLREPELTPPPNG